jgi:hypothetical protein
VFLENLSANVVLAGFRDPITRNILVNRETDITSTGARMRRIHFLRVAVNCVVQPLPLGFTTKSILSSETLPV